MSIIRALLNQMLIAADYVSENFPDFYGIPLLRAKYLKLRGAKIGAHSVVYTRVCFYDPENISIGSNCAIGKGTAMCAEPSKIVIGDNVLIAEDCYFRAANHKFEDSSQLIRTQGHKGSPIVIGNNVWIGAKTIILAGAIVGDGAVIGAASLVNKQIEPNAVAAGIPIRKIRSR